MSWPRWALGWGAVSVLALAAFPRTPAPGTGQRPPTPGPVARLLGPFASLAASIQWSRVERDLSAGRYARGYARAETALGLDPASSAGWSFLAHHLVYLRARPEVEAEPEARRVYVRAGIALLARGEALAADPARLAFEAGLALIHAAAYDEIAAWPGGAAGALQEAAGHFERAAELGHPLGAEIAALARERAGGSSESGRSGTPPRERGD